MLTVRKILTMETIHQHGNTQTKEDLYSKLN